MGKGDIKSRRGKIKRGTFGKNRPHKSQNKVNKKKQTQGI
ncbi:30S ribosomal protein THX [Echinicola pacifica]